MADDQFDFPDEEDNDYGELICYYFYKGFTCKEIRQFLSELAPHGEAVCKGGYL